MAEPKGQSALFEIRSIADEIAARNHQHHCEVLVLEETQASAEQAIELNVTEGTRIFHSVMVHYENDIPVQIEDRCVNAERIPDYLNQDYTQTTPHAYLSLVAPLTEGEHIVEAVRATPQECELLRIKEHDPCLLIRRRTGRPRKLCRMRSCCSRKSLPVAGPLYVISFISVIANAI